MDQADLRRWLLVAREVGVPGEKSGGNQWSLDHLFLDNEEITERALTQRLISLQVAVAVSTSSKSTGGGAWRPRTHCGRAMIGLGE